MAVILKAKKGISMQDRIFYTIVDAILLIALLLVFLPMLNIFSAAFSSGDAISAGKVFLFPVDFTIEGFKAVFRDKEIVTGYINTIFYTITGTCINLVFTILAAYPLSRRDLPGRNYIMGFFAITMFISGGIVPSFILMKDIGLYNTIFAMIIPGAVSVWNIIITRTFFQQNIPSELQEAAYMDGCTDFKFLWSMVLPLSSAIIAVNILFFAVGHWNAFFNAILYINQKDLYPLQLVLRKILIMNEIKLDSVISGELESASRNMYDLLKYSVIIVACLPVWCMYPFVQKYFVKGIMVGSIKG